MKRFVSSRKASSPQVAILNWMEPCHDYSWKLNFRCGGRDCLSFSHLISFCAKKQAVASLFEAPATSDCSSQLSFLSCV